MKQKLLSMLALLLMMTQGAWAQVLSGHLPGNFTINADGDQVCFSQGNFQAIGTTASSNAGGWTWAFAEHQWDKIGNDVANNKVADASSDAGKITEDGTVDLFGWSSTWYYGIYYANATAGNVLRDWGGLAISNGGNKANLGWFTLSQDEWVWVLGPSNADPTPGTNCRTSSTVNEVANARFAKGSVNGINGLIIFPDVYTHPAGVTQPGNINVYTSVGTYEGNTYTTTDWAKMEAAGCVFLPAGGQRTSATEVSNDNATGCYWSGTSSNAATAYNIIFTDADLKCEKTSSSRSIKRYGESVRLVFPVSALAEGTDNSTWITAHKEDVDPSNVMLTRTLQAGGWNTFSVPFDITSIPDGWTVKELTAASLEGGTLNLTFSNAASIVAGTPYLVKVASNVVNPVFYNVTIKEDENPTTIAGVISFIPAINPTELTGGDKSVLFISGGNSLAYPSTTNNLKGFRAYFQLPNGGGDIKSYSMDFVDEEVTGIIDVTTDNGQQTTGGWYTIDGRRLEGEPTEKGVYIQNGKKVIIK